MDFMQRMKEKIFEKFDSVLNAKKYIEIKVSQYFKEKFNQDQNFRINKIRYDTVQNLEDGDSNILIKLSDEAVKNGIIQNGKKKFRVEAQEGIL